ncbi:MAG: hypothetical protein ACKVOK_06475 [Flavobacteriales bacterium]
MRSIFSIILLAVVVACNTGGNYKKEISELDSLMVRVDSVPSAISHFNADSLSAMAKTITSQLDYIQNNFVGEMRLDIAKVTGECRIARKALKTAAEQISETGVQCAITKKQLADLKQALAEGATHDAAGNKMDDSYVQKALAREREEAGKLIKARILLEESVPTAKEKFLKYQEKMQHWVDSIPAKVAQQPN